MNQKAVKNLSTSQPSRPRDHLFICLALHRSQSGTTYLGTILSIYNVHELWLEARTADQEAIDITLRAKGRCCPGIDAAAVDDADLHANKRNAR